LFFKKLKSKTVIILEVEEIYDDVKPSKLWRYIEYKVFKVADKYIFPTELLNKKINNVNKPYVVVHGTYCVEEKRTQIQVGNDVHIVYAGTFDPIKGGAQAAAAAAEHLPQNYHVHIIGFGSEEQVRSVTNLVLEISKKTTARITYDGLLKDEEYIQFLQKSHVGLSTQTPDGEYNETSFPSKILSYMANGLRVVSVRIKVVKESAIGDAVYYYSEQTPRSIAEAIMSININDPYDSRALIEKLDKDFERKLIILLES
jgi:ribonucleotide reductase alpha subunit